MNLSSKSLQRQKDANDNITTALQSSRATDNITELFSFPVYRIESVSDALSQMECVRDRTMHKKKQNHSHSVYFDSKQELYYKTWPKDYVFRNAVVEAFSAGFYDREFVPAFAGFLVDDEGINRGYVMHKGDTVDANIDTTALALQLVRRAKNTQYFFTDLMPHNIIRYNGQLCIIDLESVAPLRNLRRFRAIYKIKIYSETYRNLLLTGTR